MTARRPFPPLAPCKRIEGPTIERLADADDRIARGRVQLAAAADPVRRERIERRLLVLEGVRLTLTRELAEDDPYGETRRREIVRRHREGTLDQRPPRPSHWRCLT